MPYSSEAKATGVVGGSITVEGIRAGENHSVATEATGITGTAPVSARAIGSTVFEPVLLSDGTTQLSVDFADIRTFGIENRGINAIEYDTSGLAGAGDITITVQTG